MTDPTNWTERVEEAERTARKARLLAALALGALAATWIVGFVSSPQQTANEVRTRVLVIEDAEGRDRMVLGAPMPDSRQVTGLKILNPDGAEQFGLALQENGEMAMGFDVQPGVGNPANRERLNLGVNPTGQGWIRFLDNQTRARMWVSLDAEDQPRVQFLDWTEDGAILARTLGYEEDTRGTLRAAPDR